MLKELTNKILNENYHITKQEALSLIDTDLKELSLYAEKIKQKFVSIQLYKHKKQDQAPEGETTRGGKTFSAARRGTENPPCVLVSLAVNVLQK